MQYMKLDTSQRQALLAALSSMPAWLSDAFAALSAEQARTGPRSKSGTAA